MRGITIVGAHYACFIHDGRHANRISSTMKYFCHMMPDFGHGEDFHKQWGRWYVIMRCSINAHSIIEAESIEKRRGASPIRREYDAF